MSDLEMKSFGPFEIKSEDKGEVVAIVATLGVVDKDGDVIMPGAVPPEGSRVKLSGYNHDVITDGAAPVGKGVITEEGDKLIFKGNFFMSTQRGREAFLTTKELGQEGEWSFGFPRAVKAADMTDEWRSKGAKRVIAGLNPIEASPVFVGAGWGTQTLLTKSAEPEAEPGVVVIPAGEDSASGTTDAEGNLTVQVEADAPVPEAGTVADDAWLFERAAEPVETEAQNAAKLEAEAKATHEAFLKSEAMEEYERVQRALKRMGYAA